MKTIVFATLAFAVGGSASRADQLARFVAISLTTEQGMRAIVSNVITPANGIQLAPCPVQVRFFRADGSMIGDATAVQLKAGESTSVPVSQPANLVRAVVSIDDVIDAAKLCALRTSVEIFDKQTGTTFNSVTGESIGASARTNMSGSDDLTFAATHSGRPLPKTRPPVIAVPHLTNSR